MTEPKTVKQGLERFRHILENARKCIEIGELEAAEEQLMRARSLEPAQPDLYDVWATLERARGRFEEAERRLATAWDLEPNPSRGLKLAQELSPDARLHRLRDLWERFPNSEELAITLTRAELALSGFDAGDRASRVLVDCPGGSTALMDALARVMEGGAGDEEAMAVFSPLVSAEITRRTAIEATGELPSLEEEETLDINTQEVSAPPAPANPPSELSEATIDVASAPESPSRFGAVGEGVEEARWTKAKEERDKRRARIKKTRQERTKLKAEDAWVRKTWRTRLGELGPLAALVPSTAAAAWVGFGGGYLWMVDQELESLLMYATMPTLAALGGSAVGSLSGKQAGMSALVVAPILGIVASTVATFAYERAVEDAVFSVSADPFVLFATAGVAWGFAALAGLRGCT